MHSSSQKPKGKRVYSQDNMAFKFQKSARRWAGLGISKQQQVYRDRNIALTAKQQQLAADAQKLNETKAKLMQVSRNKFREADAIAARGRACETWANQMVHGEEGEVLPTPLARSVSMAAMFRDKGVDPLTARRVAVAKESAVAKGAMNAVLAKGSKAWYTGWNRMAMMCVTIKEVHYDDDPPYYTVNFDGPGKGERQVGRDNLVPM